MRRQSGFVFLIIISLLIPVVFVTPTAATSIANAGDIKQIDGSTVGWWNTYDGLTVIANETGEVIAFDIGDDGSIFQVWNISLNSEINSGAIDNIQHRLAFSTDSGVKVVSTEFHSVLYSITVNNGVDTVAWDNQGDLLIGDRGYRHVMKYDDTVDTLITTQPHLVKLSAVIGLPDGRIVSGGKDLVMRVSSSNGTLEQDFTDISSEINGFYLIDNGNTLLVVSTAGQLITYSISDWNKTGDVTLPNGGIVESVLQGNNGDLIVGTHHGHLSLLHRTNLTQYNHFSSLGRIVGISNGLESSFFLLSSYYGNSEIVMFDIDSDGDGVVDSVDKFPNDGTQQIDTDNDGYGDNLAGLNGDVYPYDSTQWADSDGDGYGDNAQGTNGDAFPNNPDQYQDTDGDGYGDNSVGLNGDDFPNDITQWSDSDGDTLGDNPDGTNPDSCPNLPGTSTKDRKGCPDNDQDGYSNPLNDEIECSALNPSGPDAYPQDPTQWCDTDGDNFGDNLSSPNNPDYCISEWGNSTRAIYFDENGIAQTIPRFGCIDLDGDGYEDSGERDDLTDWSTNKTEWVDSDRDGVGDNADWDPNDPTVKTLEQYCEVVLDDYSNCADKYVIVEETDVDKVSSSEKRNELFKEFLFIGGGIGVALIAFILATWGLVGLIKTSISKRATDAQYSHQDATKELQAWEEGEEFKSRGGITDEKGWEGEQLGDGVTEDQLWDMAEEIAKPSAVPDASKFSDDSDSESDESVDDGSNEEIEQLEHEKETQAKPEPEPEPEITTELPPEAPKLPEGGLPAGWTMEQWTYYGHQWWDAKNKQ
ncbi:MAG: hypothetical protein CMO20_02165 [Thermoplasmata archaeon]|nr:hypothetical protein [Thermoplasmata archaeon]